MLGAWLSAIFEQVLCLEGKGSKELKTVHFLQNQRHQDVVTLAPGQMVFVITQ